MFKWLALLLGGLTYALANTTGWDPLITDGEDTTLLLKLIKHSILERYDNICTGSVLSGGFVTLKNGAYFIANHTVNNPNLFITCSDDNNSTQNFTSILQDFAFNLSTISLIDDSRAYLSKDAFEDSILMITFATCAVCIGMWMVYLVLMLLPIEHHNGNKLLLRFYVLFCAIYETAMLNKTVETIFKRQYNNDYQDVMDYEDHMTTTAHRVGEVIANVLVYLNWTSIVFYMFHNYKRITRSWLPSLFNNRNKLIIYVGVGLTIIDTALFAAINWNKWYKALQASYIAVDFLLYTVFCGLTAYFVWHDFRFILAPKRVHPTSRNQIKTVLLLFWRDYHETIPLLIYNMALFSLLYFTAIYFMVTRAYLNQWKFKVIKFLKLVITVSVWGLIGVLEKRELILSKETVLGRKISNDDEFFFDPELPSKYRNFLARQHDDSGSRLSVAQSFKTNSNLAPLSWSHSVLRHPLKVWKSQLQRTKNLKKSSRRKHRKLLGSFAVIGDTNRGNSREKLYLNGDNTNYSLSSARGSNEPGETTDFVQNVRSTAGSEALSNAAIHEDGDENASVETELARNYIYDHSNCK